MYSLTHFSRRSRRGSVLLSVLLVIVAITMLLSAILPMTLSAYGLSRADRDRVAALAAAEAGLNWEIARINNRRWSEDDSGTAGTVDNWPDETSAAPGTASTRVLLTDASGNWTQRFIVGTTSDPMNVGPGGSFTIVSQGEVRAPDGHIIRRRVKVGGGGLFSLFDTAALFAFKPTATGDNSDRAWEFGGSGTIIGGCGSNGLVWGNGSPSIQTGPLGLWGPNARMLGVSTTGVTQFTRPTKFNTETADEAADLLSDTTSGVSYWRPTSYNADGSANGPLDEFGRVVNSQAEIVTNDPSNPSNDGIFVRAVQPKEFLDVKNSEPVLDGSLVSGSGQRLRFKPGIYYFAKINLGNSDVVEIANDWYKADGTTPLWDANHQPTSAASTASVADYNSLGNRITIFVDARPGGSGATYTDSGIGSGLYTALAGDKSDTNNLRYRRPSNFRIYAKNTGDFSVGGSSSSSNEFNVNLVHYNKNATGSYYGNVTLNSGCYLIGGLFAWTVVAKNGATVKQYGTGVFSSSDPVMVVPVGELGSGPTGAGTGTGSSYGGWKWQEITVVQ